MAYSDAPQPAASCRHSAESHSASQYTLSSVEKSLKGQCHGSLHVQQTRVLVKLSLTALRIQTYHTQRERQPSTAHESDAHLASTVSMWIHEPQTYVRTGVSGARAQSCKRNLARADAHEPWRGRTHIHST